MTRSELFDGGAHRKALTFHDLRATGITWCAVRGDDPLRIMQRAGHATFSTTQIYIREAENLRIGFGTVFPPLPASLYATANRSIDWSTPPGSAYLGPVVDGVSDATPLVDRREIPTTMVVSTASIPGASTMRPRFFRGLVVLWGAVVHPLCNDGQFATVPSAGSA